MEKFDVLPLYRALVANAQDILGVLTTRGVIVYLSPAAGRILRRRPEQLQGRHWIDQIHPDDRGRCRDWLEKCDNDERHVSAQLRAGAPGHWRHLVLSGLQIAEDHSTFRIVFSARDASEEVSAQQSLEEREARFRSAFDDAPIGKALLDADGAILDANKKLSEILDRWSSELEALSFSGLFSDCEGGAELLNHWNEPAAWDGRESAVVYRRGEQRRHLRVHFAPVRASGVARALAQVEDVSGRIEAEQALVKSLHSLRLGNAELQKLAWMASHDLKEPLRGLTGSLQLILRRHREVMSESERETATEAVAQAKALRARLDEMEASISERRQADAADLLSLADVVEGWRKKQDAELERRQLVIYHEAMPSLRTRAGVAEGLEALLDVILAACQGRPGQLAELRLVGSWTESAWEIRLQFGPTARDFAPTPMLRPGGSLFGLYRQLGELGMDLQVLASSGGEHSLMLRLDAQ